MTYSKFLGFLDSKINGFVYRIGDLVFRIELFRNKFVWFQAKHWLCGYLTLINPLRDDGETSLLTKQPE